MFTVFKKYTVDTKLKWIIILKLRLHYRVVITIHTFLFYQIDEVVRFFFVFFFTIGSCGRGTSRSHI